MCLILFIRISIQNTLYVDVLQCPVWGQEVAVQQATHKRTSWHRLTVSPHDLYHHVANLQYLMIIPGKNVSYSSIDALVYSMPGLSYHPGPHQVRVSFPITSCRPFE